MFKYFFLQLKRLLKLLPMVLCVTAVLFSCLLIVYNMFVQMDQEDEANGKIVVAVVGNTDDPFLQMGISALTNMDSSRFMLEVRSMDRESATRDLELSIVDIVAVIPDGFVEEALMGTILPIEYISVHGAANLVSAVKDEVTVVITDILLSAQKGIYGTWNIMWDLGFYDTLQNAVNGISIQYAANVFSRANGYEVKELGISDGLDLQGYLLCGLCVLLMLLITLSFAPVLIKKDHALHHALCAKNIGHLKQYLMELLAYLLILLLLTICMLFALRVAGNVMNFDFRSFFIADRSVVIRNVLLVMLMVGTFSFLIYELSESLISGILLSFFLSIGLCFAGGCLYPAYFFPESIQQLSAVLPTGLARELIAGCISGKLGNSLGVLMYSVFFAAGAATVRYCRGQARR